MTPREYHLKRKYGLTLAQYHSILRLQGGKCAVCQQSNEVFRVRLAVDHDHITKEIRGLLCFYCNRYVIGRHRDPELLYSASQYLRQGTGYFVPPRLKKRKRKKRKT